MRCALAPRVWLRVWELHPLRPSPFPAQAYRKLKLSPSVGLGMEVSTFLLSWCLGRGGAR
jgi:hypothetical protein